MHSIHQLLGYYYLHYNSRTFGCILGAVATACFILWVSEGYFTNFFLSPIFYNTSPCTPLGYLGILDLVKTKAF